ncbi:MAG TPA: anion permease [Acidobacteriota bacterium]|jgi:PiT family inorganic phosphate transporter
MSTLILLSVVLLAYSNGANDNFKGVATLFGSGTANYRRALAWAVITTFMGSVLALLLAQKLVEAFQGREVTPQAVVVQQPFLLAVSLAAALTVLLATWTGLPVSTTHALTGALVGAGLVATGGEIKPGSLLYSFVLPLLCSPLLATALTLTIYPVFRLIRQSLRISSQSCICVGAAYEPVRIEPDGTLALVRTGIVIQGQISECVQRYQGRMLGLQAGPVLDAVHYLSAGAVGFARGLNDTPKIVALLLAARTMPPNAGLVVVAIVMALGGVLSARRVAETISQKITRMNPGQGITANLATGLLVILASRYGLPVSTTHVSVGALFGVGIISGTARRDVIVRILLAWITTAPLGLLLACGLYCTFGSAV